MYESTHVQKIDIHPPEFGNESSVNQMGNALDIIGWPMLSLGSGVVCGEVVGPRSYDSNS